MQIPCSFYFGSVFFAHTFRSSNLILPPSRPCPCPLFLPIVSFAFVLLPLCHVFYPCRFVFLFLLRRRAYYALHILHFYLKATQRNARRGETRRSDAKATTDKKNNKRNKNPTAPSPLPAPHPTSYTAKIVMKFLLYDKVKYFLSAFLACCSWNALRNSMACQRFHLVWETAKRIAKRQRERERERGRLREMLVRLS